MLVFESILFKILPLLDGDASAHKICKRNIPPLALARILIFMSSPFRVGRHLYCFFSPGVCLFVCDEVLRPSQPNGVMSSAVSLPNHTFTGQA